MIWKKCAVSLPNYKCYTTFDRLQLDRLCIFQYKFLYAVGCSAWSTSRPPIIHRASFTRTAVVYRSQAKGFIFWTLKSKIRCTSAKVMHLNQKLKDTDMHYGCLFVCLFVACQWFWHMNLSNYYKWQLKIQTNLNWLKSTPIWHFNLLFQGSGW